MSELKRETVVANVLAYVSAWNAPDAAARAKILGGC
jgi:hypothetical protein